VKPKVLVLISHNPEGAEYLMNRLKIVHDLGAKDTKLTNILFASNVGYDYFSVLPSRSSAFFGVYPQKTSTLVHSIHKKGSLIQSLFYITKEPLCQPLMS